MNKILKIVEEINEKLNDIDGLSGNYLVYAECVRNREDDYTAIKLTDHTLWDHWGDVTSFNEEELEYTKDLVYAELYDFLRNMSLYFKDDRRKKIQELIKQFGDRLYLRYQDYD